MKFNATKRLPAHPSGIYATNRVNWGWNGEKVDVIGGVMKFIIK